MKEPSEVSRNPRRRPLENLGCQQPSYEPRRLQVSDLAALIGWERSRVSRQLRRLCERGLAQRVASEHDGRATDAILTKAGRAAIKSAAPGHVAFVRRMFFDPLPGELLAPLAEALEHVYVNINFK